MNIIYLVTCCLLSLNAEVSESIEKVNLYKLSEIQNLHNVLKEKEVQEPQLKEYLSYLIVLGLQFHEKTSEYKTLGKEVYGKYQNADKALIHPANNKTKNQISKNFNILLKRVRVFAKKKEMIESGKILFEWEWVSEAEKQKIIYLRKQKALAFQIAKEKAEEKKKKQRSKQLLKSIEKFEEEIKKDKPKILIGDTCTRCNGSGKASLVINKKMVLRKCIACKGFGKVNLRPVE